MSAFATLSSGRVRLRRWRDEDREAFAAMNSDARVMEFFPSRLGRAESDAMVDRIQQHFSEREFGLWAACALPARLGFIFRRVLTCGSVARLGTGTHGSKDDDEKLPRSSTVRVSYGVRTKMILVGNVAQAHHAGALRNVQTNARR